MKKKYIYEEEIQKITKVIDGKKVTITVTTVEIIEDREAYLMELFENFKRQKIEAKSKKEKIMKSKKDKNNEMITSEKKY